MKKGIAIAGNLIVDNIKYINTYPPIQTLTAITETEFSTGGLCCNCAMTLASLDPEVPIKAIGIIGNDDAGNYILEKLGAHSSIDISGISHRSDTSTSYTDCMTEIDSGKRTFFHYYGASALLVPDHFDFTTLEADILHIGYILTLEGLDAPDDEYPTAMCRVLDAAQKAGILTSIDVVSEDSDRFQKLVSPALKYADYCIINEFEASKTTGIPVRDENDKLIEENLPAVCKQLIDMGVSRLVVIHMPELSCGLERGGEFLIKPSWQIPEGFIKSTIGAGDVFASTVLYGAYNGWGLDKSMHIAGAVAGYSLSGSGADDAIKPLDEILEIMESYQK